MPTLGKGEGLSPLERIKNLMQEVIEDNKNLGEAIGTAAKLETLAQYAEKNPKTEIARQIIDMFNEWGEGYERAQKEDHGEMDERLERDASSWNLNLLKRLWGEFRLAQYAEEHPKTLEARRILNVFESIALDREELKREGQEGFSQDRRTFEKREAQILDLWEKMEKKMNLEPGENMESSY